MTSADLPLAMRLKSQAGWNQVEADWQRFMEMQPDGCFVAELDDVAVGTTVTCIFGDVAWIAMVLVEMASRGRGIGTGLMKHALRWLDSEGVATVRLDATPLGRPIYEKLGFVPEYTLTRFAGLPATPSEQLSVGQANSIRKAQQADFERLLELDRSITGTVRRKFLVRLWQEYLEGVRLIERQEGVEGYLAVRLGSEAVQIGPCLGSPEAGTALLADALERYDDRRVYCDVPERIPAVSQQLEALGLKPQRTLVRMCRGSQVREDSTRLLASSGPELG